MDTFETIKKFLAEGGKCLLIEDGKPIGVVLTMEEYEKLRRSEAPGLSIPEINGQPTVNMDELDFGSSSDDITLEDLGLDEMPE
ncbi:MAG: hypothetical protein Q7K16_00760 [Candidatus Azambacteria bacterium]|nr:hypothetical protein [Candidatus Azambacteria bacterium]